MICVVDANNLAGKLGLLDEPEFDKLLAEIAGEYFSRREMEAFLVFDSNDPMGDKVKEGNMNIVMAPRGERPYSCADDKILEIIEKKINSDDFKDEITVVTDDNELKDRVSELAEGSGLANSIHLLSCAAMAERINKVSEGVNDEYFAEEKLSDDEEREVNDELRDIWN